MSTASDDLYAEEVEYATAVAAAAFAISALEAATRDDEESQHLRGIGPSLEGPSKADISMPPSDDGNETAEKIIHPVPPTRKRLTFSLSTKDSEEIESMKPKIDTRKPYFPPPLPSPPPLPTTRRRPTFSLNSDDFEETERMKPKIDAQEPGFLMPMPPPPPLPSTRRRPTFSLSSNDFEESETMKPSIDTQEPGFLMPPPPPIQPPFSQPVSRPLEAQKTGFLESEADAWERAELDKIKKRHEDLILSILEWEEKRKRKAKRKLEKTEGDPGRKRAKALEVYQADIERITQIAEGAKAQAKEKRRKEELKVKDKADKYRVTGKPPATCLCF